MLTSNYTTMKGSVSYQYSGLFVTHEPWIHPERIEDTYEIIYVVKGMVYLREGNERYALKPGEWLVLRPGIPHGGYEVSDPPVSFYWIHFYMTEYFPSFPFHVKSIPNPNLLKELLHYGHLAGCPSYLPDAILTHLLCELAVSGQTGRSKLTNDILEWTRMNADAKLTVEHTARHFGYHPEHISRLIRRQCGTGLKTVIARFVIAKANDRLCNTNDSVKEIAGQLGFCDANAFIHFYRYHEHITPSQYRNRYSETHMNKQ